MIQGQTKLLPSQIPCLLHLCHFCLRNCWHRLRYPWQKSNTQYHTKQNDMNLLQIDITFIEIAHVCRTAMISL